MRGAAAVPARPRSARRGARCCCGTSTRGAPPTASASPTARTSSSSGSTSAPSPSKPTAQSRALLGWRRRVRGRGGAGCQRGALLSQIVNTLSWPRTRPRRPAGRGDHAAATASSTPPAGRCPSQRLADGRLAVLGDRCPGLRRHPASSQLAGDVRRRRRQRAGRRPRRPRSTTASCASRSTRRPGNISRLTALGSARGRSSCETGAGLERVSLRARARPGARHVGPAPRSGGRPRPARRRRSRSRGQRPRRLAPGAPRVAGGAAPTALDLETDARQDARAREGERAPRLPARRARRRRSAWTRARRSWPSRPTSCRARARTSSACTSAIDVSNAPGRRLHRVVRRAARSSSAR